MEFELTGGCDTCIYRSYIFDDLDKEKYELLTSTKEARIYKKGETIVEEGKEITHFLYLKKGLVKLYKKGENRQDQIISIGKPLDFIGLLTVFSDTHYHYNITAIEDSYFCFVDINLIKQMITENGKFAMEMLQKISYLSDQIIQNTYSIAKRHLRGRIAFILIDFAEDIYQNNRFELPISRKEIGELIGMTTENVIRILSEFRKDNIIKIEGKVIEINDIDRLKKISKLG